MRFQQNCLCTRIALDERSDDVSATGKKKSGEDDKERALVLLFNDLFVYATKKAMASPDPVKNSFVVPLNLVWVMSSVCVCVCV